MIAYPSISPEIFSIGSLSVRWYGLMYVIGYVIATAIAKSRVRRGLFRGTESDVDGLVTYLFVGMLLGARIFYAFVYNFDEYRFEPWRVLYVWQGGLSFHGAVVGMVSACALFARRHAKSFYQTTDLLAISAGPGLFLGRIGNFINGELYGRATDVPWAMIFPRDPLQTPRHPSQLYQGLTEGLLLWGILFAVQAYLLRRGRYRDGIIGPLFLIGYGIFRFLTEFAREPDAQLGFVLGSLSMGQVLCVLTALAGVATLWHSGTLHKPYVPQAPAPESPSKAKKR